MLLNLRKTNEHNINEWLNKAQALVGKDLDVKLQSTYEVAGKCEVIEFVPDITPEFTYSYRANEEQDEPDSLLLGTYTIKFKGTKFYNNKTFHFRVKASFADDIKYGVQEYLYISTQKQEDGKWLKAYCFGINK